MWRFVALAAVLTGFGLVSCSEDPEALRWQAVEAMVRDASADSSLTPAARAHADSAQVMFRRAERARDVAQQQTEAVRWRERAAIEAGLALVALETLRSAPVEATGDSVRASR